MNSRRASIELIEDNLLLVCDMLRESGDEAFKEFIAEDIYYVLTYYGINELADVIAYIVQHVHDYESK